MNEVLTSIRRTPYQSLAAFLVLFFTLFLSSLMFISLGFFYGLLGYVETRPQVNVYFQTKISENTIFKVREDLVRSDKVQSVKYISQAEALKIYKESNKDNPLLLEMVSADILPASLEIYAKKPAYLPEIADFLKKQPGVDEVNFQKDIVDRLLTLTTVVRRTVVVFFAFLIIMSIIVLFTTTLFKIALKKDEIELMRLLGASYFYIKKPFLMEGVVFGLSASILSFALLVGVLLYLKPMLSDYLAGIPNLNLSTNFFSLVVWPLNIPFLLITFFLSFFFGVTIAVVAVFLATQKYLKI